MADQVIEPGEQQMRLVAQRPLHALGAGLIRLQLGARRSGLGRAQRRHGCDNNPAPGTAGSRPVLSAFIAASSPSAQAGSARPPASSHLNRRCCRRFAVGGKHRVPRPIRAHPALVHPEHPRAPRPRLTAGIWLDSTRISAPRTMSSSRPRARSMKAASPARIHSSISRICGRIAVASAKRQADHHARGIDAHRQIEEIAQVGEAGDVLRQPRPAHGAAARCTGRAA